MKCLCDCGETYDIKIEGDVGADPFWCNKCSCNFNIDDFPISQKLSEELLAWSIKYGEWIDWEYDRLVANAIQLEDDFNRLGAMLTEKVKQEIGTRYLIQYFPSTSARLYLNK
ncbi:hypothetical protein GMD78_18355 [Ornithinibacillus sp. L9]|uniref:Uncharacterized protein n=1 Tax=Ornithinibacillus caprae TaxID=2678566 RepID=A0A6N8FQK0_9BACI|nr:hypothetical protein [Ornithinibacillus caprae]MUK90339.1 hypothetical protein [Ornithinibacillus caprae]